MDPHVVAVAGLLCPPHSNHSFAKLTKAHVVVGCMKQQHRERVLRAETQHSAAEATSRKQQHQLAVVYPYRCIFVFWTVAFVYFGFVDGLDRFKPKLREPSTASCLYVWVLSCDNYSRPGGDSRLSQNKLGRRTNKLRNGDNGLFLLWETLFFHLGSAFHVINCSKTV